MRTFLQYLAIALLVSCGQRSHENEYLALDKDTSNEILSVSQDSINQTQSPNETPVGKVEFEEFSVSLVDYSYYRNPKRIGDTIRLETEVGENLDYKLIQVIPKDKSDKFEVYVTLERNLTVSVGEKQSIDLTDWKKFDDYVQLRDSSENYFKTIQFRQGERENELNKDFQNIKTKVLELKGEYITERLDSATSLTYLPVELWVSRVVIKIIRTKTDGTRATYYIDAVSPWGC